MQTNPTASDLTAADPTAGGVVPKAPKVPAAPDPQPEEALTAAEVSDALDDLMKLPEIIRVERACLDAQPKGSVLTVMKMAAGGGCSHNQSANGLGASPGSDLQAGPDSGQSSDPSQVSVDEVHRMRMEKLLENCERRIRAGLEAFEMMRLHNPSSHAGAVCQLHYLEGMTWQEVARRLGIAESSVFRARKEGIAWLVDHPDLVIGFRK